MTMQRDDGHRLDLVEVDNASYQIDHDDAVLLMVRAEKRPRRTSIEGRTI
jgi:hypothetical protein